MSALRVCSTLPRVHHAAMLPITTAQLSRQYKRDAAMRVASAAQYPTDDGSVSRPWLIGTAKAMVVFMAPALILPLSDPLMSLIDAVCLGQVRAPSHCAGVPAHILPCVCAAEHLGLCKAAICFLHQLRRSTSPPLCA